MSAGVLVGVVLGRRGDKSTVAVDTTEFLQGMSHTIDGEDSWRETESIKCIFACCGVTRGFTHIDPFLQLNDNVCPAGVVST